MSYGPRSPLTMGPTLTPMVKYIILACVGTFVLQSIGARGDMIQIFGVTPYLVLTKLFLWQLGTYLFLHGNLMHLLLNMFVLWMFGCELERHWGSREFLRFFLVTGIGAGLLSVVTQPFSLAPTIGASGSIYGILAAYGLLYPERTVLIYFLFPVKVKYFVAVIGLIAFWSALSATEGSISHIAHLGGMIFGFLYLKGWLSPSGIRQAYYRWRLQRMRNRFKVYDGKDREQKRKDDFWIN